MLTHWDVMFYRLQTVRRHTALQPHFGEKRVRSLVLIEVLRDAAHFVHVLLPLSASLEEIIYS